jgi:hypothetical protein
MADLDPGLEHLRPEEQWLIPLLALEGEFGGEVYPWYLLPFDYEGEHYDPWADERALYLQVRDKHPKSGKGTITAQRISDYERLLLELCKKCPAYFIHNFFYIRDKSGRIALFDHWNLLQRNMWYIYAIQRSTSPIGVRLDVLKSRQEGGSLMSMALICAIMFLSEDRVGLEMSNKDGNARRTYKMAERFYSCLKDKSHFPKRFVPIRQNYSGLRLAFGSPRRGFQETTKKTKDDPVGTILNSSLEVLTAATTASDVGFTADLIHLTELALWPCPSETWENLSPGIADIPGSLCVRESVAWQAEDWWHGCIKDDIKGDSDFRLVFSGWNEHPIRWSARLGAYENEYRRDLPARYATEEGRAKLRQDMPAKLQEWMRDYSLSDEQAYWALKTWQTKCGRDWDRFCRQYPLSVDMAFRFSGTGFFNREAVQWYLKHTNPTTEGVEPPVWTGDLYIGEGGFVQENHRADGYLRVWKRPVQNGVYVGTADGAEGQDPDGDFSVTDIFDARSGEQCAQLMIKLEQPRYHASQIKCLDEYYGNVFWVPECAGSAGYAITDYIQPTGEFAVKNLYIRETLLTTDDPITTRYGFNMAGRNTKFNLLSRLREEVNAAPVQCFLNLHSYETAKQLSTYVRRPDGTYGNVKNKKGHDDCVISAALAVVGFQSEQRVNLQGASRSGIVLKNWSAWATQEQADRAAKEKSAQERPGQLSWYRQNQGQGTSRFVDTVPAELLDEGPGVVHPELGIHHD